MLVTYTTIDGVENKFYIDPKSTKMQTYSGKLVYPVAPTVNDINIYDIAHSLSMQCRYNGHCCRFYSVAEHSVLMAYWLFDNYGRESAFAGLMHDASEAYLCDVPRPLKPSLTNYKAIEANVNKVIADKFGLPQTLPEEVHEADSRIIADELVNLVYMPWHDNHDNPLGIKLRYWRPEEAEREFILAYEDLRP